MKHFIDPLVDCVFKAILGSEKHTHLLIHFLNGVGKFNKAITSITIENPYSISDHLDAKMHIVDIKARDNEGRVYQIEIQLTNPKHLPSRMLHNLSQIHSNQISKGDVFNKIVPTIAIWLLTNDISFANNYETQEEDVKLHFTFCDINKGAQLSQDMSLYLINMHRWKKPQHLSDEDYWLYFLTEAKAWKELPPDAQIPQLQEAMAVLEEFSEKEESYYVYQSRLAAEMAARSEEYERQQMAEENAQMAEENAQMAEENAQLVEEKVKLSQENTQINEQLQQAQNQVLDVAKNLLQAGNMSVEQISTITNLPLEQIKALQP